MKKSLLLIMVVLACLAVLVSPAMADDNIMGVRTINPSSVEAGDTFRVTVTMTNTGSSSLTGPAIQENLPSGWTATAVNNGGMILSIDDNVVEWLLMSGALNSGETMSVTYDVTVPASAASGSYSISGLVGGTEVVSGGTQWRSSTTTGDTDVEVVFGGYHIYEGDDFVSIIQDAPADSTIYWHAGNYTTSHTYLILDKSGLKIIGDGSDLVKIEGLELGNTIYDDFSGEAACSADNLVIEKLTFTSYGPAFSSGGDITVRNCMFIDRVTLSPATLIENCTFYNILYLMDDSYDVDAYTGGIIRNNVFYSMLSMISSVEGAEVSTNLFKNVVQSAVISTISTSDFVVTENTFENCTPSSGYTIRGTGITAYLNNFVNTPYTTSNAITLHSPTAIDYTYMGSSYSSVLGNYYDGYTGEDAGSNGIGDTAYTAGSATDSYPLMGAWNNGEIESSLTVLYEGTVDVMEKDFDFTASNSGSSYPVSQRTDLGALMGTGLDCCISDSWYSVFDSFLLESIAGIENQQYPGAGWGIYVNGVATNYGIGANTVSDGDVVSFYYAPYDTETYAQNIDEATYVVHITVNDETPVEAVRTITTKSLDIGSDVSSTMVTVKLTAVEDIASLHLTETIPAGWTFTQGNKDGALFREDIAGTYEWIWSESMSAGESKTITYVVEYPSGISLGDYKIGGIVSAYVGSSDIDGINVLGNSNIEITEDWNPWDDIGSESDEIVTSSELQEAIKCWLHKVPAPVTGAEITSDRLQEVIHLWLMQ
jgi:uncharacterized repeat protein (TIGR01451 family)